MNNPLKLLVLLGAVLLIAAGPTYSVLRLAGSSSGLAIIQAPSVAGTPTLTLPTVSGTIATRTGSVATNDCAKFDSSGRLVSAGAACGTGSGGGGGTGDVVGPASATAGHFAIFDGTTGKLLKDSLAVPAASATTDTTNATNISGGTLASARLPTTIANDHTYSGVSSFTAGMKVPIRVIAASGSVTVSATTDYMICLNKTTGAATSVNLPGSPATGLTFLIKDCKGDAATNNITVAPASGNIDGSGSYVINTDRGAIAVVYSGSEWVVN